MKKILPFIFILIGCLALTSCKPLGPGIDPEEPAAEEAADSRYLSFVDDEPGTMDPQCTTGYYTIPLNVFDRLVEVKTDRGTSHLVPSLAESWDISSDGLTYTFRLRPNVVFSNGSALTSEDVRFTLERLLTNPQSQNQDVAMSILGAEELHAGQAKTLEGFEQIDDLTFRVILAYPYGPFLANLSTPGASILDKETVTQAGEKFGTSLELTVGTGAFMLEEWITGEEIKMKQNPYYWGEMPGCDGLRMLFLADTVSQRAFYDAGKLDILDLEYLGNEAEYFVHGDIYRANLVRGPRVGITYIALNESVPPLNDVRVRKALQLSLDRDLLMNAMVSGRGNVENGIFPYGLLGHNRNLEEIPFDVERAKQLLADAGLQGGFELELYCTESASESDMDLYDLLASMWEKIGVKLKLVKMDSDAFMELRKKGDVSSYVSTWSADFNDPDNFIYTFFGSEENTVSRSLCYPDKNVIGRVLKARSIVEEDARIAEYQDLEKKIVQEDAAWIPLYSRLHLFVVNDRVEGFQVSWNGWSSNNYRHVTIR